MTLKDQFTKLKENWLILVLVILLVFFTAGGNIFSGLLGGVSYVSSGKMMAIESADMGYAEGIAASRSYYPSGGDFAPEVETRKIIKTASLSTQVDRGEFQSSETKLKNIITSSDSFILNENVYKSGTDRRSYYRGSYQLRVEVDKYDSVVSQLKEIGEVQTFSENANDVTGRYVSLEDQLQLEKERLQRYKDMLEDAEDINDKINLNDRIFNQERTIKYLEDAIKNIDQRIDYTTISFSMTEKQSEYANVVVVKFSELWRAFVNSFNNLTKLFFVLIPWVIAAIGIKLIWTAYKRRRG